MSKVTGMWQHEREEVLLIAFRELWKEWGDSNFHIFSQNCQFHHRRLESLVHFNVFLKIIYHSEHYGHILDSKDAILFLQCLIFCVHFACALCV